MSRTTTCLSILWLVTLMGCAEEKASLLPDGGPIKPATAADAGVGGPTGRPTLDGGLDAGRRDAGGRDDDDDVSDEPEDEGTDAQRDAGDDGLSTISVEVPAVDQGELPGEFRCNEDLRNGTSPEITWTPGPAGTKSYALTLRLEDPEIPSENNNWTIFDIPANVTSLPPGIPAGAQITEPISARQARNSQRLAPTSYGYYGPCSIEARYELTVYALDVEKLPGLPAQPSTAGVEAAIEMHTIPAGVGSTSFSSAP